MIVVDTNLICYLFLTGDRSTQAEQAFQKDPDWLAPLLWRSEFRNVLAQYLRRDLISLHEARLIMEQALLVMSGREFDVNSFQVLSLVNASNCSAYDCEFVALAQDLGIRLVTVDHQILNQFSETAVLLEKFIMDL
jgi:predicted nucleic acid-binding protein